MAIDRICNREVITCERDTNVLQLAALMRKHHVGDIVVTDSDNGRARPVGIVTDRDLVVEVLAMGVDPQSVFAGDVMGARLVQAQADISVRDAVDLMRGEGVRRLPLVDRDGTLAGIVSIDDCIRSVTSTLRDISELITREQEIESATRKLA